jgi:hypothetical protein
VLNLENTDDDEPKIKTKTITFPKEMWKGCVVSVNVPSRYRLNLLPIVL